MNVVALIASIAAIGAVIFLWRKVNAMTLEERALSSISFVKQIMTETRDSISKMLTFQETFADKLAALIKAVQDGGKIPQSVTTALSDLVDASKGLSAGQALLDGIPDELDQAIDGLTPKANG